MGGGRWIKLNQYVENYKFIQNEKKEDQLDLIKEKYFLSLLFLRKQIFY